MVNERHTALIKILSVKPHAMQNQAKELNLTRIGVFYDGSYFLHVSNYYTYSHDRRSRISISGLHNFIRNHIAKEEETEQRLCQIVDAHYFRGRLNAKDASEQGNSLYYSRVFDDILSSEGVTTHYLPVRKYEGVRYEKGIDVWLALEAFELAFYKRFNVLVLIASDGDYVPLIKKLNTLGTRVMVLSWDFEYKNDFGKEMKTRTSQELLEEVTYPVLMHELIDNRVMKNDPLINNLFVPSSKGKIKGIKPKIEQEEGKVLGEVLSLLQGYGFIKHPDYPKNLFFHYQSAINVDFNDLEVGNKVSFDVTNNDKGDQLAINVNVE